MEEKKQPEGKIELGDLESHRNCNGGLGVFDSNKDGKINSSDAVWQHLSLFVDENADGTMDPSER